MDLQLLRLMVYTGPVILTITGIKMMCHARYVIRLHEAEPKETRYESMRCITMRENKEFVIYLKSKQKAMENAHRKWQMRRSDKTLSLPYVRESDIQKIYPSPPNQAIIQSPLVVLVSTLEVRILGKTETSELNKQNIISIGIHHSTQ